MAVKPNSYSWQTSIAEPHRRSWLITASTWLVAATVMTSAHALMFLRLAKIEETAPVSNTTFAMTVEVAPVSAAPLSEVEGVDDGPADVATDLAPNSEVEVLTGPEVPTELVPLVKPDNDKSNAELETPDGPHTSLEDRPADEVKTVEGTDAPQVESDTDAAKINPKKSQARHNGGGPKSDAQSAIAAAGNPSWLAEVRNRVVRVKRYPSDARAHGQTGTALVAVTISGSGQLAQSRLASSSRVASLDAEAVAVMYRAAPFPPPPGGKTVTLKIPVTFSRR